MTAFQKIGEIDQTEAVAALERHRALFHDLTFRQDHPASPHRDTETIYLRMPREITVQTIFESLDTVDYPACRIEPLRTPMEVIAGMVGRPLARAMIINLHPGGCIAAHVDEGSYADATDRFHLPLVTNEAAWMRIGAEKKHLEAGSVYRFNKHRLHEGANDGATDRIHMVVDLWR